MDLVSGLRFVLALVVVLGLIAALAWILRRYGAGRVTLGATKAQLPFKAEQDMARFLDGLSTAGLTD